MHLVSPAQHFSGLHVNLPCYRPTCLLADQAMDDDLGILLEFSNIGLCVWLRVSNSRPPRQIQPMTLVLYYQDRGLQ